MEAELFALFLLLVTLCLVLFARSLLLAAHNFMVDTFCSLRFAGYSLFLLVIPICFHRPLFFLNIALSFSLQLCSLCSDEFQSGIIALRCHQLENYDDYKLLSFHTLHSFD